MPDPSQHCWVRTRKESVLRTYCRSATVCAEGGTRKQALLSRAAFESRAIVPGEPQMTHNRVRGQGAQPGQEVTGQLGTIGTFAATFVVACLTALGVEALGPVSQNRSLRGSYAGEAIGALDSCWSIDERGSCLGATTTGAKPFLKSRRDHKKPPNHKPSQNQHRRQSTGYPPATTYHHTDGSIQTR